MKVQRYASHSPIEAAMILWVNLSVVFLTKTCKPTKNAPRKQREELGWDRRSNYPLSSQQRPRVTR
ncbi:hypothetical protein BCON_0153g00040 [Botryotinia convoluta]|uniref:Uncharacterized protein n=1 Tax=Botryotinia convoluta TaxID=54673 RepID=A0A4Z1HS28_9HELO|nr:hypothetical protein BCON_0153g00040 [Botryotinia convoluta]